MSFNSEYQKLRQKRKEQEQNSYNNVFTVPKGKNSIVDIGPVKPMAKLNGDIGPVNNTVTTIDDKESAKDDTLDFFKKGAMEEGATAKNIGKAILGTLGDAGLGISKGLFGLGEGLSDAVGYAAAGVADLIGKKGWADDIRRTTQDNYTDDLFEVLSEKVENESVLGRTSRGVMEGVGQAAGLVATAGIGGMAGLGVKGTTALTSAMTGLSGFGSGTSEAYQSGATDKEAVTYGMISAASDALTEMLFGGLGKGANAIGLGKGLSSADDMLAKKVSNMFSNQIMKNFSEFGIKASAEGVEEVLAGVTQAFGKKLTYMSEEDLSEILKDENLFEQFVVGSVTSGIMQAGDLHRANTHKTDFIGKELSQNEQAVFDKIYNDRVNEAKKGGKKLSGKDKENIHNSVMNDMEKGYIGISDIESVLGGETYKQYQSAVEEDNRMKELQNEYDTLYKMKNGEKSDEQIDRQKELKQQLDEYKNTSKLSDIQKQLSNEVSELAKTSKLAESYNEKSRRSQTFEADLTQYDEKHQGTYKRAMESGVLNNTNRTHEFVDLLAKLEADKGVLFDFTNNEKIKETGFAIEGKQVNGYVQGNNISINIDSTSAFNKVVGHEITHVLEGTELYTELANAVKELATTKGEYDSKLQSITKLYEGIENANIENELTADLIGEYLFTDSDFINRLSAEKPTLFQKIFDEIKYLCKVATAGSKEARQLEKVKKTFEEAYRQKNNTATDDGVRYNLNNYSEHQIENWKNSKNIIIYENSNQLLDFVKDAKQGNNLSKKMYFGSIPKDLANEIHRNTGIDVSDYNCTLRASEVKKIFKSHGNEETENKRGQRAITENDFVLIPEVIQSPDSIALSEKLFEGKPVIEFTKVIDGKVVVSAYVSKKHLDLTVQTMFAGKKKGNLATAAGEQAPADTPEANVGTVSTNIISNPTENVNKYSLSNADDIGPVREHSNVYGEDIKLHVDGPVREDIAPGEATTENSIINGDEPIKATQSAETTKSSTHEDLVNQISDIMDEAPESDVKEDLPDYFVDSENKKKTKSKRKALHENIIAGFKSKFNEQGFDLDEELKKGKRHGEIFHDDNTPQRIMEKTFGYKAGRILADLTVNKIAQNETEGIKWLNTITGKKGLLRKLSKEYHIKPYSKEDAAAQMYLEGFYVNESDEYVRYGDAELAADFPDRNVRENIRLFTKDPRVREFYDLSLNAINEARVRNAYDPIPRRDNYALHFRAMDDVFSKIGVPLNPNDIKAKDLPTDLNGVTVDLKPGQPYFASAKHRVGVKTTYSLLGGMERYANSAKNQIYHIDDIQNLRALRNYIADTFGQAKGLEGIDEMSAAEGKERIEQVYNGHLSNFAKWLNEEANHVAGKTALIDRAIPRRALQVLSKLNGMVGSNQVGFNISSSLTNIIPVVQTFARTNKYDFAKAFSQTVLNTVRRRSGNDDGFAEKSPVMIRRKGAESFAKTPYQKATDAGYAFMSAVDGVATELIARTKFNEYTRKGMDEQKAHIETDKWVSKLMGDRSLGQQPLLYNSKTYGLFTKYQLEVRNQLDSMFYDTIQEAKEKYENIESGLERNAKTAAKYTATLFELAVAQHIFGTAFEAMAGYNPAFDIIEVIIKACGFDDEEDSEDDMLDNLEQAFFELLGDMPYSSLITDGGRIPISSALPIQEVIMGKDQNGYDLSREERGLKALEALPYYLLPTGYGQIKKTAQGLSMFLDDDLPIAGSYTDSGKLRFTVEETMDEMLRAGFFGQYASKNARQYFDENRSPLSDKKTQELIDLDVPIEKYWEYQDGLKALGEHATLNEKGDYIANLEGFTVEQKNILINNIADRDEPIDLTGYENYSDFQEFDFATRYPEKYAVLQECGISVSEYKEKYEKKAIIYTDDFSWASNNAEKFTVSKAVTDDVTEYKKYTSDLSNIKSDKDKNGNSISGSAKRKKVAYINSLDIEKGAKLILYKSQYKSDDTYNTQIIEYLKGRKDITRAEKETILTELGFTVHKDGRVTW